MTAAAAPGGPVRWDPALGAFVVTGFAEAAAVLRGEGWSSDPANSPLAPPELTDRPSGLMLFRDPPDHTRLRRLVAPAFAARAVEGLRERVGLIVDSCLAELAADSEAADSETAEHETAEHETGELAAGEVVVDLMADYAYLIPLAVIAELLDVGVEGAQVFLDQTPQLVRMLEVDAGPADLAAGTAAAFEVTMFLTPVLSDRRRAPGDDFVSALLAQPELSLDEVLATCILLLAAGHETTANLIGNGALALLRDPGQQPALQADPARAVEELLRLQGPVRLIARYARHDHDVGGVRVPAGAVVLVRIDQANRDPRRWTDPARLDLTRPGPAHLGFGTGIHFCLGAALARLEAAEALTRLFRAFPGLAATTDAPQWRNSSTFHGLQELPVRLR